MNERIGPTNQNARSVAICQMVVLHGNAIANTGKDEDKWTEHKQNNGEHKQPASGFGIKRQHDLRSAILVVGDVDALNTWWQVGC